MPSMVKLEYCGVIYYFSSPNVLYGAFTDTISERINDIKLLQRAEFAVDIKTNEMIKCRARPEDLIEAYFEVKECKQHP